MQAAKSHASIDMFAAKSCIPYEQTLSERQTLLRAAACRAAWREKLIVCRSFATCAGCIPAAPLPWQPQQTSCWPASCTDARSVRSVVHIGHLPRKLSNGRQPILTRALPRYNPPPSPVPQATRLAMSNHEATPAQHTTFVSPALTAPQLLRCHAPPTRCPHLSGGW